MIKVNQLKLHYNHTEEELIHKLCKLIRIQEHQMNTHQILKKSIDARKKPEIFFSYVVGVELHSVGDKTSKKQLKEQELQVIKRANNQNITQQISVSYTFPKSESLILKHSPIVVGMGPAGLFCAYMLAVNGYRPLIIERGEAVEERKQKVAHFWETGELDLNSNVQFGEGGAGTFSDGKLNTLLKDSSGRNQMVLELLVQAGAPKEILYDAKPHVGTDILEQVIKNMRATILEAGGRVRFGSMMTGLCLQQDQITGIMVNDSEKIETNVVVLAIGHSARDTFEQLQQQGIEMEAKSFAVGFRVEHPQAFINEAQYGKQSDEYLPPASYKVTAKMSNGRGVYSFCMCPGGYVVDASSEAGRLAVNGMSYSKRDGDNANSAIVVSVTPKDFQSKHPLAGIAFQRELEARAYRAGQGKIPIQCYKDFKERVVAEEGSNNVKSNVKGDTHFAGVHQILPEDLNQSIVEGMEHFNKIIPGFAADTTLLLGVESRTSSPVRILRDEKLMSKVQGLYPCGEGAGYAGGIMSAAMDGIKVAEEIAKNKTLFL